MSKKNIEKLIVLAIAAVIFGIGVWALSSDPGDVRDITAALSFAGLIALAARQTIVIIRKGKREDKK